MSKNFDVILIIFARMMIGCSLGISAEGVEVPVDMSFTNVSIARNGQAGTGSVQIHVILYAKRIFIESNCGQ